MRFVAKEVHLCPLMLGEETLRVQQAKVIHDYYLKGMVQAVYHIDDSENVFMIMDCITKREAEVLLAKLPLVRAGKSTFEVNEIKPYRGYEGLV